MAHRSGTGTVVVVFLSWYHDSTVPAERQTERDMKHQPASGRPMTHEPSSIIRLCAQHPQQGSTVRTRSQNAQTSGRGQTDSDPRRRMTDGARRSACLSVILRPVRSVDDFRYINFFVFLCVGTLCAHPQGHLERHQGARRAARRAADGLQGCAADLNGYCDRRLALSCRQAETNEKRARGARNVSED